MWLFFIIITPILYMYRSETLLSDGQIAPVLNNRAACNSAIKCHHQLIPSVQQESGAYLLRFTTLFVFCLINLVCKILGVSLTCTLHINLCRLRPFCLAFYSINSTLAVCKRATLVVAINCYFGCHAQQITP